MHPGTNNSHLKPAVNKIDSLQALRAFAAIFVMVYHGTTLVFKATGYNYLANFFTVGFMGVDVFFVLSGFIIFHTYAAKKIIVSDFLRKRFVRVVPIYWLVIIGLIIIHIPFPAPNQAELNDVSVLVASFTLYPSKTLVLGVAWTLTYEILFYIVFALTAAVNTKTFYYTFTAWGLIIIVLYILKISPTQFAANALINPVILNFGFGCVIAYLYRKYKDLKYWHFVAGIGFLLLCITWCCYYFAVNRDAQAPFYTSDMSRVYLFGIPSAVLIYGLLYLNKPVPGILVRVGDASYSLYLIHAAVITLLLRFAIKLDVLKPTDHFNIAAVATLIFVLTIAVSLLFYKFIEKPLIKLLNKRRQNNAVW